MLTKYPLTFYPKRTYVTLIVTGSISHHHFYHNMLHFDFHKNRKQNGSTFMSSLLCLLYKQESRLVQYFLLTDHFMLMSRFWQYLNLDLSQKLIWNVKNFASGPIYKKSKYLTHLLSFVFYIILYLNMFCFHI